jgi:hypothetical protein
LINLVDGQRRVQFDSGINLSDHPL